MLTERQEKLIKAIIEEYIKNAEPVGSQLIFQNYALGVSPATIRNEMAYLTEEGFLEKPHVSAGRIPTSLAFRHFIKNLMEEEALPVVSEVSFKQHLWEKREHPQLMLRQAVYDLAEESRNLSLALLDNSFLYYAGAAYILDHPEFYDIDLTRSVLKLLDEVEIIRSIFEKLPESKDVNVLLGDELGYKRLNPCSLVFGQISFPRGRTGYIGILGPMRLNYGYIIPRVRYFQKLINELGQGA
ncbi:hypothetical protein B5M47_02200 [candidate division CPR3 bacterium 4484_211]|uniref:Heat-inducible transcription repressor HrcA n=1 Tax=candidate division CPR3 bacterium 4484_211 TaxID=1968527 RepID=A0A1W9NYC1_UNCC3|nr:MAG: hypothetical protein B5M47_02200 [candidate division CPR3 bacterium 4484_211]